MSADDFASLPDTDDVFDPNQMVQETDDMYQEQAGEAAGINDQYAAGNGQVSSADMLFTMPAGNPRELINYAGDGRYLSIDPESKNVSVKKGALLSMKMITSKTDPPFVLAASEKDITNDVDRVVDDGRRIYTLPLGIGWSSGARCSAVYIPRITVEYSAPENPRATQVRASNSKNKGKPYEQYVRVGVPLIYTDWIAASAAEIGLRLTASEKDSRDEDVFIERDGKKVLDKENMNRWMIATLPKKPFPTIKINRKNGGGVTEVCGPGMLRNIMDRLGKGAVCNAVFRMSAKRPENYDGEMVVRNLGLSLISMEIVGVTSRQSRPLDPIRDFEGTGEEASSELEALLVAKTPASRPGAQAGPARSIQTGVGASAAASRAAPRAPSAAAATVVRRSTAAAASQDF